MIETVASSFSNESKAKVYLEKIREARPRYIRDQLQLITKQIKQCGKEIIDLALEECLNRQLFSATEFSDVVQYLNRQRDDTAVKNLVDYGGIKSIHRGYKVIFTTMGELIQFLKTQEITRKSQIRIKRIRDADLVVIDDLMFMAMNQSEANLFFHLINDLYNTTSIILTSNKAPKEWGELLVI